MKKPSKKLALGRETLRRLQNTELHAAAGGQTKLGCTTQCTDPVCPTTQFDEGCNSVTNHC
jgi:hypothetical protein